MNTIRNKFKLLREQGKCALIPYFMANYPQKHSLPELLKASSNAGADFTEIGIPFSDPVADGPAIQEAGYIAIRNGATLNDILETLQIHYNKNNSLLLIMSYINILIKFGFNKFLKKAKQSGIHGIIIPDLIFEEGKHLKKQASDHIIDLIDFVSPTTPLERLKKISNQAKGFIYYVSTTGVTGARPGKQFNLKKRIREIKKVTDIPVCVGFGIATPEQAVEIAEYADGIIIGSALIKIMKNCRKNPAIAVDRFLSKIRQAID